MHLLYPSESLKLHLQHLLSGMGGSLSRKRESKGGGERMSEEKIASVVRDFAEAYVKRDVEKSDRRCNSRFSRGHVQRQGGSEALFDLGCSGYSRHKA